MTDPIPAALNTPAWDALVDEMNRQFCELHHIQGEEHDPEIHLAQVVAFLGGLMLGVDFHKQFAYDSELLLDEYQVEIGTVEGNYQVGDEAAVLSALVRRAHMGDPAGR